MNVRSSVKVGKNANFRRGHEYEFVLFYEDNSADKYVDTKVKTPLNTIKVRVDKYNKFDKSISYSSQVNHIYYLIDFFVSFVWILRKFIEVVIIVALYTIRCAPSIYGFCIQKGRNIAENHPKT